MSNGAGKFSPFSKMSFYPYRKQYALLRSTGSELGGGQSAQPRHWGPVLPLQLRRLWPWLLSVQHKQLVVKAQNLHIGLFQAWHLLVHPY